MVRSLLRAASSAVILIAGAASAHLAPPVVRADRTLTITLGERTTLTYAVRLSPPELSRVRREGDADRDGALSRAESDAVFARMTAALREDVRYASGRDFVGPMGRLVAAFAVSSEAHGLEGPNDATDPARLSWTFDLRLARGDDRLAIEDRAAFVTFDHSDVLVRDAATRPLVGLGVDAAHLAPNPSLGWVDAGNPGTRTVHVVWRTPPSDHRGLIMAVVIVLGLGIIAATLWSTRRG